MLFISLLPIIFYFRGFVGFFQQDEWFGYAWYLLHKDSISYVFTPSIGHYNPLNLLANHLFFLFFGMNYEVFFVFSILLHVIVIILVYLLAREITKNRVSSIIAALLFAAFASHYQGTAWVVANIGTHMATILGLASVIFFIRKRILISLTFLIISLLFKEITVGLFPLFLGMWFIFFRKEKSTTYYPHLIILTGVIFVVFRLLMILAPNITNDQLITQSQSVQKLIYNFFLVPVKSISQTIIPFDLLRSLSEFIAGLFPSKVTGEPGSPEFEVFVIKRVFEFVTISISIGITLLVLLKNKRREVIFGLLWILVNSFIFAISPESSGVIFAIDSRNLYFTSIGSAIMLATIFSKIPQKSNIKMYLLVFMVVAPNIFFLNQSMKTFTSRGLVRKNILHNISLTVPDLPNKTIIYTRSSQSYYGLPEDKKILPFQSGFGQTLLGWYYPVEKFPEEFFSDRFLWEIESQGYKEIEGRGFGYFRDLDLLRETIKQYNLPKESVFAFDWDGKKNFIGDITDEVRQELYGQKK